MIKNIILANKQLDELIDAGSFEKAAGILFSSQFNVWKQMRENYNDVNKVKEKSFWFEGFKFKVQFNPNRIKSTSADVSDEVIKNRYCFLCLENLPPEQKGILLNNNYILLCNPYPIFHPHFTVSHVKHKPQSIKRSIKDLLVITKQLSKKYTLIYNGPLCGASAPDHLHFQALTKNIMPVENDIYQLKNDYGEIIYTGERECVSLINDGLRKIVFIEAIKLRSTINLFEKLYKYYSIPAKSLKEPLMNLICSYDEEFGFNLIVFLRSKHRPESYFEDGLSRLMISPAAVDLGGVLIAPREEDFNRIDKHLLRRLLREISLNNDSFEKLKKNLEKNIN